MVLTFKKKILFIVQHRYNRSPGQRYRCEQYIKYLEERGFECTYSPTILTKEEDIALYESHSMFSKANILLKSFIRRWNDLWRSSDYDIIYIYREAFMTGSLFFEKRFKKSGAKIVFDFDDAIWLPSVSAANRSLAWLKKPEKVKEIIRLSDVVIAGNTYLSAYATQFNKNVVIFPSTIDLDYYKLPAKSLIEKDAVTIGWSGSHTTVEHFETIVPVLKKLKEKFGMKVKFVVYGDAQYKNEELQINGLPWSAESEVNMISSFDIGIMPLPDNEWTRGKCAMKGLQYMGLSIPAVLSAVGMNNDVIEDGVNGYLIYNDNQWEEKLSTLIEDKVLRKKMGAKGRETVEQKYAAQSLKDRYIEIFDSTLR